MQHCLVTIIEKWKEGVNNGGVFDPHMKTDLYEAFDSLHNELLTTKPDACGNDSKLMR